MSKTLRDLTKRDIVAVTSATLQQAYISTDLKYSDVDNAQELLIATMSKRAKSASLAAAADATFVVLQAQVPMFDAQDVKYAEHRKLLQKGYKMLSTKGRGVAA